MDNAVKKYLASIGRKGGKATGPRKARTSEQARKAARERWAKRFTNPKPSTLTPEVAAVLAPMIQADIVKRFEECRKNGYK